MRSLRSRGTGSVAQPIELSDGSPSSSPLYPVLPAAAQRKAPTAAAAAAAASSNLYPALHANDASGKRAEKRTLAEALDGQGDTTRPGKLPSRGALKTKPSVTNAASSAKAVASGKPSPAAAKPPSRPTSAASNRSSTYSPYKGNSYNSKYSKYNSYNNKYKSYNKSNYSNFKSAGQRPYSKAYGSSSGGGSKASSSSKRGVATDASLRARKAAQTRERNKEVEAERTRLEQDLPVYVLEQPVGVLPGPKSKLKPLLATTADREEAAELIACIPRGVPLSIDAEWRFDFRGGTGPIALLQIAGPGIVLLLQLARMKQVPEGLQELLLDASGWKVGVSISNDARKMLRDWNLSTAGLVDLGTLAKMADPDRWRDRTSLIALRDLSRIYLKRKLRKDATRTSNWEVAKLTAAQIEYGACDVYAGLEIGWLLMEMLDKKLAAEAVAKAKAAGGASTAPVQSSTSKSAVKSDESASSSALPSDKPASVGGFELSAETRALIQTALFGFTPASLIVDEEDTSNDAAAAPATASGSGLGSAAPVKRTAAPSKPKAKAAPACKGGALKSYERAYAMWLEGHEIEQICIKMRTEANPLKFSTVVNYLIQAASEADTFPPRDSIESDEENEDDDEETKANVELWRRMKAIVKLPESKYAIAKVRPFLREAGFLAKGEAGEGWSESSDSSD